MSDSAYCQHCSKPFVPRRQWQRFCSPHCRSAAFQDSHFHVVMLEVAEYLAQCREQTPVSAQIKAMRKYGVPDNIIARLVGLPPDMMQDA